MRFLCPMTANRLLFLWMSLLSSLGLSAQIGGNAAFSSLNIQGSARVAALGGNIISIKDGDINLVATNPALIDSTIHGKLALSYVDYFDGINLVYASYAHKLKNPRTTFSGIFQYISYGQMAELDGLGNEIGQFSAGDYALVTGIGHQVDSLWSIGANWKNVFSSLGSYNSYATAFDFGATYQKASRNFSAGFVLKNVGIQVVTFNDSIREKLPIELQVGISKRPRHAPFRFSLTFENLQKWNLRYEDPNARVVTDPVTGEVIEDNTWEFGDNLMRHVVIGTEFLLSDNFHIQIGYNYRRRQELKLADKPATAGLSFGLGLNLKRFSMAYGRAVYHAAGPSNHLTLSLRLHQ